MVVNRDWKDPIQMPKLLARVVSLGFVYFGVAVFCLTLSGVSNTIAFLWFPNAIVFSYILRRPKSESYFYALAVLVANTSANLLWGDSLFLSFGISVANCLEIFGAVMICRKFNLLNTQQGNVPQYLSILAIYTLIASTLGAAAGSVVVWFENQTPWWTSFQSWWLGDSLGFLMFGILGLQLSHKELKTYLDWRKILVDISLLAGLVIASEFALKYFAYPFILIAIPFTLVSVFVGVVRASIQIILTVLIIGSLYYFQVIQWSDHFTNLSIKIVWLEIAVCCFFPTLVGIVIDELKHSKNEQQSIIDQMPVMIGYWDSNCINRFANKTYLEYFGMRPSQIKGIHIRELLGETRYKLNLPYINGVLAGTPQIFERVIVDTFGTKRYTIASYIPDIQNAEVVGFFVFVTDNTQLKLAQLGQMEAQKKLQSVIDSATDFAIIAVDTDGVINLFNTGAEKMLGYGATEIIGKNSPILFHDTDELEAKRQEIEKILSAPISSGEALLYRAKLGESSAENWTYIRNDKQRLPVHVVTSPTRDLSGAVSGFLFIAKDITKELQAQNKLSLAKEEAERANRIKSDFLASMSHEIRTPLNVILGISQILLGTELTDSQKEYVQMLVQSGHSLLHIINDILDFSKIEAGKMQKTATAFDVREMLSALRTLAASLRKLKQIEFRFSVDEDVPKSLVGDSTHIQQVLVNFVSNAVKFTEKGSVTVEVQTIPIDAQQLTLFVRVKDTGIGMTEEDQKLLFLPFSQLDASITRKFGGTGLGLSISKRLVELMNGEIGVESQPGVGSEFWIKVPCTEDTDTIAPHSSQKTTEGKKVLAGMKFLLVEDNAMNQTVAVTILNQHGGEAEIAVNGMRAVETLKERPKDFDCVLMDLHMPEMDGLSATRLIRGELKLSIPIIAMTAGVLNSEESDSLAAGMNAYISKPFQVETMIQTILEVTNKSN